MKPTPKKPPPVTPDPSSGSNKKGRPRRNLIADVEKVVGEFAVSSVESATFFGTGSRAQLQWLQRLRDALAERQIEDEGDEVACEELLRSKKKIEAIISVCRALKKCGASSTEFDAHILEQQHFLSMTPVVTDLGLTCTCERRG